MRLLVTGAAGFVGLNLVRALAASGRCAAILATDRATPDRDESAFIRHPSVSFSMLDTTDRTAVRRLCSEWRPTHVVHGAAITPAASLPADKVTEVFDINLCGSIDVFEAAATSGATRVVLLSSSGVYAPGVADLRREDDELALHQPYAASKHAAEIASLSYNSDTDIVSARLGPVYGPMEKVRPTRGRVSFVGLLAEALREGRQVTVSGPDISRDWTFAEDIADAISCLLTAGTLRHRIYNVSAGRGWPMSAVVECFRHHGLDAEWVASETADIVLRQQDERTPLAIDRLRNDTGFSPSFHLQQGIAAMVGRSGSSFTTDDFKEAGQ
jgi:nucleoside-diphosphate-sugar epimerase